MWFAIKQELYFIYFRSTLAYSQPLSIFAPVNEHNHQMNTPAQRFNEARAYLLDRGMRHWFTDEVTGSFSLEDSHTIADLWNSRIEPTAEHLDIIERIEAIVTKLQTT